jgi:hypothetical protein
MKTVAIVLVVIVLGCTTAFAETLQGRGTVSGNAVLWYSGTDVTATFDGTFALTGELVLDGDPVLFAASGWARGGGSGNTSTLDVEAWATFAVRGETDAGDEVSVQGGLTLSGLSADTSGSSGSGTGDFFATVFLGDRRYYAQGSATGTATGTFVVPEDPLSMELAGDGDFELSGDIAPAADPSSVSPNPDDPNSESQAESSLVDLLPWSPESWPDELLSQLLDILTHAIDPSERGEETPPSD